MKTFLYQKLNEEHYKGMVTYCGKDQYTHYYDADFKEVLRGIGYNPLSQTIPGSEKVHEYLSKRLRDHLGTQIEQTITQRLRGGTSAGVVSGEGEIERSAKQVHERAETFIGLIENCLHKQNLMVIIIGASNIAFNDLEQTKDDIFAAGTNHHQRAALTLVYSSPNEHPVLEPKIWFVYEPYKIPTERAFVDFVWSKLKSDDQGLIKNQDRLGELLIESKGSTAIIHGWDSYIANFFNDA